MSTNDFPFFILGCVRSGTTMLRKILAMHPRLECPEETHFFRWGDPFGTNRYEMVYTKNNVILHQQRLDGFSQDEFMEIYRRANSRKDLMDQYMQAYLVKKNNPNGRWFDKSPQHIYGALLIDKSYPDARFIHIVRNPLNVVASLMKGAVMPKQTVIGAVNYWNESMALAAYYKKFFSDRFLELKYEDFGIEPVEHLKRCFEFIGEDDSEFNFKKVKVHKERNQYIKVMSKEQITFVNDHCGEFMELFKYG